jgi:hypothetical protein
MRTKNQESAKISMGHLVKRDTCLSRPQAKRVGGAPAINSDFLPNTKTRVGSRVAHKPLLLNRDLLNNHNSWLRSKLIEW